MSEYIIREAKAEDYEGVARVANVIYPEPNTAEHLRSNDERIKADPEYILRRFVCVDDANQVLGYGVTNQRIDADPKSAYAWVGVHPDHRGRGVGNQLYAHLVAFIQTTGVAEISSRCRDNEAYLFAFAEQRGFVVKHRHAESVLDLGKWDGSRFAGQLDRTREAGFRLELLDEIPPSMRRAMYECNLDATRDHPEYDGKDETWEEFQKRWMEEPTPPPRRWALAWDGDTIAAMSIIALPTADGGEGAYTNYTCVRRAYRGRGLALATKLLTIDAAIAAGVPYMRTNNNQVNAPMLAVNVKLGYEFVPGQLMLSKRLA